MKVSDILRIRGNTLFTVQAGETLEAAIAVMAEKDIGSLVVVEHGELAGLLTFREVILALAQNHPARQAQPEVAIDHPAGGAGHHRRYGHCDQRLRTPIRPC